MTEQRGSLITVDPERCTGCHSCELACAVAHSRSGALFGAMLAQEPLSPRNRVVAVAGVRFATQCRQCEDAPCVKICPTGATFRTETFTAVNPNVCIACKLCMMVCPFGAIHMSAQHVGNRVKQAATKCDLCVERSEGPACVEACPTHALSLTVPRQVMEAALKSSAERFLEALQSQSKISKES